MLPGVVRNSLSTFMSELGSISGRKWNDLDGDGVPDNNEPGLAGHKIELYDAKNQLVAYTVTLADDPNTPNVDETGFYELNNLISGTYTVAEDLQKGFFKSTPSSLPGGFTLQEAKVQDIHAAFTSGILTAKQLTQLYLNRIEAYDDSGPAINSMISINPEALDAAAQLDAYFAQTGRLKGPLHGIPVIVKDNYDTSDLPTTAGSRVLEGSIPPDDAFMVKKLREAGAIVLGKSNLSEFATGVSSLSGLGGQTLNPYALDRTPYGSSGGTGAAIAANLGAVGLGTDTSASIVLPSSANDLVGLRPTVGLTSRDGIIPGDLASDVGGPMTRTVEDAARVLDMVAGFDPADPVTASSIGKTPQQSYTSFLDPEGLKGARIGVVREFIETSTQEPLPSEADPQVVALANQAIEDTKNLGSEIIESSSIKVLYAAVAPLFGGDLRRLKFDLNNYLDSLDPNAPVKTLEDIINSGKLLPTLEAFFREQQAAKLSPNENPALKQAQQGREMLRESILKLMDDLNVDALLYLTNKKPPTLLKDADSVNVGVSALISAITGLPSINIPIGFTTDGLPIGITLLGRSFSEPTLLKLAYSYEQGTQHRRPPETTPPLPSETGIYTVELSSGQDVTDQNFGNRTFTFGNDNINLNFIDESIQALAGDDTVIGSAGSDTVNGNRGNDFIDGGAGDDLLRGGSDNDTLMGSAGNDSLMGNLGDDILNGNTGNDIVIGNKGKDYILGDMGDDALVGGVGKDTLIGGQGNNQLQGGKNNDTFILDREGLAVIQDFQDGQDKLSKSCEFKFPELNVLQQGHDTVIQFSGDELARLNGVSASSLTAADFTI